MEVGWQLMSAGAQGSSKKVFQCLLLDRLLVSFALSKSPVSHHSAFCRHGPSKVAVGLSGYNVPPSLFLLFR